MLGAADDAGALGAAEGATDGATDGATVGARVGDEVVVQAATAPNRATDSRATANARFIWTSSVGRPTLRPRHDAFDPVLRA